MTIPDTVDTIYDFAFLGCKKIKEVVIPENVTVIGKGAFINCESLESIKLPSGLTAIEARAFRDCEKLKDVELPDSLSVEDLGGLKFVGQAAVNVTTLIENYNDTDPEKPIEINYTEEDLNIQLNDIQSGKYDFTIIDKPMYFGYYQPEFGYDLHAIALAGYGVGEGMDSYLIVSRTEENKQLVEDINKALREVIEEGKSKEINLKYFGDDYSPSYE